nr:Rap1a/Tai family immunity protein [uncultured Glaciecola sp.]
MKALLIASVLLITSFSSQAGFKTGNHLYVDYKAYNDSESGREIMSTLRAGAYVGYVTATLESVEWLELACMPPNFSTKQLYDMVGTFLKENPELRHKQALEIIMNILVANFPCEE